MCDSPRYLDYNGINKIGENMLRMLSEDIIDNQTIDGILHEFKELIKDRPRGETFNGPEYWPVISKMLDKSLLTLSQTINTLSDLKHMGSFSSVHDNDKFRRFLDLMRNACPDH